MSTTPTTDILQVDADQVVSYRVRTPVVINSVVVGYEFYRGTVAPGTSTANLPPDVAAFCAQHYRPQVVAAYFNKMAAIDPLFVAPFIEAPLQ